MITVDKLDELTVTTTHGEKFHGADSARLAALIYRRFGRRLAEAASAWRVLLINSTPDEDMRELVRIGLALERLDVEERSPNNIENPSARLAELIESQIVLDASGDQS